MTESPLTSTTFRVAQMDCAAEAELVRLQLADQDTVKQLRFNLDQRTVVVTHIGASAPIAARLDRLNLGAAVVGHARVDTVEPDADDARQRRVLVSVLLINLGLFVLELLTGWLANSMGLIADSLDMLADALVYGLSLYAVGKAVVYKRRVARLSGYFQLLLAVVGMAEVLRRFIWGGDEPAFGLMLGISLIALAGNVAALVILRRANSPDVHMQASWIFTSNDVLVNLGVIVAGVLVYLTGSALPDLVVGAAVFALVGYGAVRILRLATMPQSA